MPRSRYARPGRSQTADIVELSRRGSLALAATAKGDAMTFQQNQAITAVPNVLRDQTVPNTLAGFSDPAAIVRRAGPSSASVVRVGALVLVVIFGVLAVVTRIG